MVSAMFSVLRSTSDSFPYPRSVEVTDIYDVARICMLRNVFLRNQLFASVSSANGILHSKSLQQIVYLVCVGVQTDGEFHAA